MRNKNHKLLFKNALSNRFAAGILNMAASQNIDVNLQEENACPEVYTTEDMSMADRIDIYVNEVFFSVTDISGIQSAFVAYVVRNIEPVGWKAVWRSTKMSTGLNAGYDFVVDVTDVSQVELKADVRIQNVLSIVDAESKLKVKEFMDEPIIEAPLCELFAVFDPKDNGDFEKTAFALDTVRFYYEYIWRPWDDDEDDCDFIERHLKSRIKLYYDIVSGLIPTTEAEKICKLLREAKEVHFEMDRLQHEMDTDDVNVDLKNSDVLKCFFLNQRIEKIRKQLQVLENPVFSYMINHDISLKNEVRGKRPDGDKVVHFVSEKFSSAFLQRKLQELPSDTTVEFHHSLNKAISECYEGDTIFLSPGVYRCSELTWLDESITFKGLGGCPQDTVIKIVGNGDIVVNCEAASLHLINLRFEFTSDVTCGIMIHRGKTNLENCEVFGSQTAICVISGGEAKINKCTIQDAGLVGVEARMGSSTQLCKSAVSGCGVAGIALHVRDDEFPELLTTAIIEENRVIDNCCYGILFVTEAINLSSKTPDLKYKVENARLVTRFPQHKLQITKNFFNKNKIGDIALTLKDEEGCEH